MMCMCTEKQQYDDIFWPNWEYMESAEENGVKDDDTWWFDATTLMFVNAILYLFTVY